MRSSGLLPGSGVFHRPRQFLVGCFDTAAFIGVDPVPDKAYNPHHYEVIISSQEVNMVRRKTWIICSHVMDGSAETVTLRPNRFCACENCVEDVVGNIQTADVQIVEEDRLISMLKDFKTVNGREHIIE